MCIALLDSMNQGLRTHFCVPDVKDMNYIFCFIIVINEFKTTTHEKATSILMRFIAMNGASLVLHGYYLPESI